MKKIEFVRFRQVHVENMLKLEKVLCKKKRKGTVSAGKKRKRNQKSQTSHITKNPDCLKNSRLIIIYNANPLTVPRKRSSWKLAFTEIALVECMHEGRTRVDLSKAHDPLLLPHLSHVFRTSPLNCSKDLGTTQAVHPRTKTSPEIDSIFTVQTTP